MDPLIQVVSDLIMDGSFRAVPDRKIPMAVRVTAAIILTAVFCSLTGFCFYLMIKDSSWQGKACGAVILLITLHAAYRFIKCIRIRRDEDI